MANFCIAQRKMEGVIPHYMCVLEFQLVKAFRLTCETIAVNEPASHQS